MEKTATRKDRGRLTAALLAVLAAGLVAAGCGETVGYTPETGDRSHGKELFQKNCGSCHTLADAGTKGQIGPNLDDAFRDARRSGLGESTFVQVVRGQIAYPVTKTSTGSPGMPKNLLNGQDADDVASYVASVAGKN
jgi:mono/diheme cytochrome c family protein